jgi:hypothetical protein
MLLELKECDESRNPTHVVDEDKRNMVDECWEQWLSKDAVASLCREYQKTTADNTQRGMRVVGGRGV